MGELRTVRTDVNVHAFLSAVADPARRADALTACALTAEVTGAAPAMWGGSIVGFGAYHYRYASGREGDWPAVGLSPRAQALTFYLSSEFAGAADLLDRLGPHRTGKSCLYVRRLAEVDESVLRALIGAAFVHLDGTSVSSAG